MSRSGITLPYDFRWSQTHPHIAWADLHANGVLIEIAVVSLDQNNGDLYFIPVAGLDRVDHERLLRIITKRDAHKYPLWDLMSNSTLKNGINALEYFHQLVKVRSVSGQFFKPGTGKVGSSMYGSMSARPEQAQTAATLPQQVLAQAASTQAAPPARRGPGRPPAAR